MSKVGSCQPSAEFVARLKQAFVLWPVIEVHDNPHFDELAAAALSMFTERGQAIWSGLNKATPVVFLRQPKDMLRSSGLMIGIGPSDCSVNEHHFAEETTATALMAQIIGIDENHPLGYLVKIAERDDIDASSPAYSLAADVRRSYLLNEKNIDVWQRTIGIMEDLIDELLKSDGSALDLSPQVAFVEKFFADRPMPKPIADFLQKADVVVAPDSLLATAERTWRKRGQSAGAEQLGDCLRRWELDWRRGNPELLLPEIALATEGRELNIGGRPVKVALVDEMKMADRTLLPWLLKLVRSPKSHDADIVIKKGDGKIMVQTNKRTFPRRRPLVNLYGVARALAEKEPDSWYSLRRGDRILSIFGGGTLNYDLTPTKLTLEEVLKIIERFAWLS